MANLRVFVSSTCFDLAVVRSQLRTFLEQQGHLPVMSDYNDVLYDPRLHTHTSCVHEVVGCDAVVLIIGGRFGGKAIPNAGTQIDFDGLQMQSKNQAFLKDAKDVSVTQLEALMAIDRSIPVFAFVEERVWNDHATYEKNKAKGISDQIEYASIEKPTTAKYIFEFINYLRLRTNNNSITTFSKYQDIEEALRKQWSGLLQRLLHEQRTKATEARRIDDLTEQFEDLKAAILSGMSNKNEREIARGVVRFRTLYDFLSGVNAKTGLSTSMYVKSPLPWDDFLRLFEIERVIEIPREIFRETMGFGPRLTGAFVKHDHTFYAIYFPIKIEQVAEDYAAFMSLPEATRKIIFETLEETRPRMAGRYVKHISRDLYEYLNEATSIRPNDVEGTAKAIEQPALFDETESTQEKSKTKKPRSPRKTPSTAAKTTTKGASTKSRTQTAKKITRTTKSTVAKSK